MVRNAAVYAGKNIRTIKVVVQPMSGSRHPRTFVVVIGVNPLIKMAGLGRIFQYEENNSMVAEAI